MYRFLLTRAIALVFVLVGIAFITFIMGYFAPGDPIRSLMGISIPFPISRSFCSSRSLWSGSINRPAVPAGSRLD